MNKSTEAIDYIWNNIDNFLVLDEKTGKYIPFDKGNKVFIATDDGRVKQVEGPTDD